MRARWALGPLPADRCPLSCPLSAACSWQPAARQQPPHLTSPVTTHPALPLQEAIDIVYKHRKDATAASKALIAESAARWKREEGNYRDDITAM